MPYVSISTQTPIDPGSMTLLTLNGYQPVVSQSAVSDIEVDFSLNQQIPLFASGEFSQDFFQATIPQLQSIAATSNVSRDRIDIAAILQQSVTPPSGQAVVQTQGGEVSLNGLALHRDDLSVVMIYISGDWIGYQEEGNYYGLNPTFTAKFSPEDLDSKAAFIKTISNGGVEFVGSEDVITYQGIRTAIAYRVLIYPSDFKDHRFNQRTYLYYDFQLDDGQREGRRYTVVGRSGEKFIVNQDVYQGVGG